MTSNRPAARVAFNVQGHDKVRLQILGHEEDDRVPNPGDLLIVANMGDANNGLVSMAVLVAGKDMNQLARASNKAVLEYEANKSWLSQPVTRQVVA